MNQFVLIGKNISHSFSPTYFKEKFKQENISNADYIAIELDSLQNLKSELQHFPNLQGYNVTIPYKSAILPLLDNISDSAKEIGAVNAIKIKNGMHYGENTDWIGFTISITPILKKLTKKKAIIFGSGGASKAAKYALEKLKIPAIVCSRNQKNGDITYDQLQKNIAGQFNVIINTTPVGQFPNTGKWPKIPYRWFPKKALAFDLIYNPAETIFLKKCREQGMRTKNGLEMLSIQAEKSWEFWTKSNKIA